MGSRCKTVSRAPRYSLEYLLTAFLDSGGSSSHTKYGKLLRIARLGRLFRIAKAVKVAVKLAEAATAVDAGDWELPERYKRTSPAQLQTMQRMVRVLLEVAQLSRDANLAQLLAAFKEVREAQRIINTHLLGGGSSSRASFHASSAGGGAAASAFEQFEAVVDRAQAMSFANLGLPFEEVFLDLCLYRDDQLVQASLDLLMVHSSLRSNLLADVAAAQLLTSREHQELHAALKADLAQLQSAASDLCCVYVPDRWRRPHVYIGQPVKKKCAISLQAEQHELWGELATPADRATNQRVRRLLRSLAGACRRPATMLQFHSAYEPARAVQRLLRNLGAFEVAMTVLALEASVAEAAESAPHVAENTRELLRLCNVFLTWFVAGNAENQELAFDEVTSRRFCL